jgi:hypothetical protein
MSTEARRRRVPLIIVACVHLGSAFLLLWNAGSPDPWSLAVMGLLFCSGAALLMREPRSWWVALLAQPPLLALALWASFVIVQLLCTYHPPVNPYIRQDVLIYMLLLLCALFYALCSLTALLYLLRPRTRETFGRSPASR